MTSPTAKRCFDATLEPSTPETSTRNKELLTTSDNAHNGESSRSHTTVDSLGKDGYDSTPLSSAGASPSPQQDTSIPTSASTGPNAPSKKRKLTFQEKEVQRIEKEFKEHQKAEEKSRKEDEKRAKQEEKRLKDEEKARKQKEREEEKDRKQKEREEEKQRKEAEKVAKEKEKEEAKAKKDRSQMKLNAFFGKGGKEEATRSQASSRRGSIASTAEDHAGTNDGVSQFEKAFPPFFLHAHTTLASSNRFPWDNGRLDKARRDMDVAIEKARQGEDSTGSLSPKSAKRSLDETLSMRPTKRPKPLAKGLDVKTLQARISGGTEDWPIDVEQMHNDSQIARKALSNVSIKCLKYYQDVRPPYIGTYTKIVSERAAKRLPRNPFLRELDVAYDYDSEAEWEEPEEGEDLGSDDEDEDEEEDGDEMNDFLDDAEDAGRPVANKTELEPKCTGLVWADGSCGQMSKVPYGTTTIDLYEYRISPLITTATGSIDPYSTVYWGTPAEPEPKENPSTAMAPPPRGPLNPIAGATNFLTPSSAANSAANIGKAGTKPKASAKPLPPELMEDFKQAVVGSDLTKVGLVEVLKKRFPQVNSKTIQQTLEQVAKREGPKPSEKRWVLI